MNNFAPLTNELIGKIYDERKNQTKNNSSAIIILTNKSNYFVDEMMDHLRNQSVKDFDVIIVYGPSDEKVAKFPDFNAVHIIRSRDVGPSGGFYLAEKYALEQGYDLIIRAESDAMPVDKNLIQALFDYSKDYEVVMPRSYNHAKDLRERGVHRYTSVNSSVYKKLGISFFPFYFGGEDLELQLRLQKNCKVVEIDNYVVHPIRTPIVMNSFKQYYFTRNELFSRTMHSNFLELVSFSFRRVFHPYLFMLFTGDPNTKAFSKAISDFFSMKLWIEPITNVSWNYFVQDNLDLVNPEIGVIKTNIPGSSLPEFFDTILPKEKLPKHITYFRRDKPGLMNLFSQYSSLFGKLFMKDAIASIMPLYDLMFYSLICKSISFKDGKNWYYKTFSIFDRIKTLVSLALIPATLLISLLFAIYMKLFKSSKVNAIFNKFYKECLST